MNRLTPAPTIVRLLAAAALPAAVALMGCDQTPPAAPTAPPTSATTVPTATAPAPGGSETSGGSSSSSSSSSEATTETPKADDAATQQQIEKAQQTVARAVEFLKKQQKPDGGWQQSEKEPPAITAIVLKAIMAGEKHDAKTDWVKKGYDKLLSFQVEDGGIYKDLLANYNTAIAVSALLEAENPAYKPQIDKAVTYLKQLQWTQETDPQFPDPAKKPQLVKDENDAFYGGFGYGGHSRGAGRPDLSNTQLALEALKESGLSEDDPAFKRAAKFVTRMQNLSETNDQPWAGDDGGFVYSPADNRQGESFAGEFTTPEGDRRLRSYGSMTYAGLKSMIYAGLKKDDPRVKAAWDWVTKNWTLDENPGMRLNKPENAQQGLYYYYHTLAKALNAYDQPTITDPQGTKHDWRVEFIDKVASLQKEDGSWVGDKKWMENNPVLVTAYTTIALEEAIEDLKQHPVQK